jgi:hypothetical protein
MRAPKNPNSQQAVFEVRLHDVGCWTVWQRDFFRRGSHMLLGQCTTLNSALEHVEEIAADCATAGAETWIVVYRSLRKVTHHRVIPAQITPPLRAKDVIGDTPESCKRKRNRKPRSKRHVDQHENP